MVLKSRGFVILIRYITQGLILAKNRNYPYQNEDYYRKFNPSEITTLKEHKHCTLVCDEWYFFVQPRTHSAWNCVASHPLIKATHPSLSRLLQPRSAENNTENLWAWGRRRGYLEFYYRRLAKKLGGGSGLGLGMSLVKDWDATTPRPHIFSEIVNLFLWDSMNTMVRFFYCKKFNGQKRKIRHKKTRYIRFHEENSHFL